MRVRGSTPHGSQHPADGSGTRRNHPGPRRARPGGGADFALRDGHLGRRPTVGLVPAESL